MTGALISTSVPDFHVPDFQSAIIDRLWAGGSPLRELRQRSFD